MAIPSRQIGWGTESNLLWQILKQLTRLTSTLFSLKEAATPKYKVYTALLTQEGTDAPIATVLEDTIGNIYFSYLAVGSYKIENLELYDINKTVVFLGPKTSTGTIEKNFFGPLLTRINTYNSSGIQSDGTTGSIILFKTPIEIRIYN